jgi:Flp pilus assembly protein TadG
VVEFVIIIPVAVLFTMLVVQFGLQMLAQSAAEAAAQDGVRAARGYGSSAERGRIAATDYVHRVAPTLLRSVRIDSSRSPTRAAVRVRADVLRVMPSLIPAGAWRVDAMAVAPVERFVPPAER